MNLPLREPDFDGNESSRSAFDVMVSTDRKPQQQSRVKLGPICLSSMVCADLRFLPWYSTISDFTLPRGWIGDQWDRAFSFCCADT